MLRVSLSERNLTGASVSGVDELVANVASPLFPSMAHLSNEVLFDCSAELALVNGGLLVVLVKTESRVIP